MTERRHKDANTFLWRWKNSESRTWCPVHRFIQDRSQVLRQFDVWKLASTLLAVTGRIRPEVSNFFFSLSLSLAFFLSVFLSSFLTNIHSLLIYVYPVILRHFYRFQQDRPDNGDVEPCRNHPKKPSENDMRTFWLLVILLSTGLGSVLPFRSVPLLVCSLLEGNHVRTSFFAAQKRTKHFMSAACAYQESPIMKNLGSKYFLFACHEARRRRPSVSGIREKTDLPTFQDIAKTIYATMQKKIN